LKEKYKDKKRDDKIDALKNKEVKKLIFDDALRQATNIKTGQKSIKSFFN
jgi:hypothetical protein